MVPVMGGMTYKHRPLHFDDLVLADPGIVDKLVKYVDKKHFPPIFIYGSAGIGKTILAELFAEMYFRKWLKDREYEEIFRLSIIAWDGELGRAEAYHRVDADNALARCLVYDKFDYFPASNQKELVPLVGKLFTANEKTMAKGKSVRRAAMFVAENINAINKDLLSYCQLIHLETPSVDQWLPRIQKIVEREGFDPVPDNMLREFITYGKCNGRVILRELESYLYNI